MIGYIYSLSDKNSNDVFYIGASSKPEIRVLQHKTDHRFYDETLGRFVPCREREFNMDIIDELHYKYKDELFELEEYWIHQFKQWGFPLTNKLTRLRKPLNKIPSNILKMVKKYSPNINPYRTVEKDDFIETLYRIINDLSS